jgi:hypothetical protein
MNDGVSRQARLIDWWVLPCSVSTRWHLSGLDRRPKSVAFVIVDTGGVVGVQVATHGGIHAAGRVVTVVSSLLLSARIGRRLPQKGEPDTYNLGGWTRCMQTACSRRCCCTVVALSTVAVQPAIVWWQLPPLSNSNSDNKENGGLIGPSRVGRVAGRLGT